MASETTTASPTRAGSALLSVLAALLVYLAASGRLLSPTLFVLALGGAGVALWAQRHVALVAGLGIAAVCLIPIYWTRQVAFPVYPTPAVLASLVLLPVAVTQLRKVRLVGLDWAFGLYVVLLTMSTTLVLGGNRTAVIQLLTATALPYVAFRAVAADPAVRRGLAIGIAAASAVLAPVAFYEIGGGDNPFFSLVTPRYLAGIWAHAEVRFDTTRAEASFGHPIAFGMFLVVALLLALGLSRESRRPTIGLVVAGLTTAALIGTLSRGPLVAAAIGVVLWLLARRRALGRRDLALVALVALALLVVPPARDTVGKLVNATFGQSDEASTATYRVDLFRVAQDPAQFSLFGQSASGVAGGGTNSLRNRTQVDSIDSEYVLIYLRNGLLPLAAFSALLVLALRTLARGGLPPLDTAWLAAAAAVMIGLLSVALITQFAAVAYMVLGVAAATTQVPTVFSPRTTEESSDS
ncbi:MAG: hypothetical protein QOK42_2466 [Frankiaceae bacterium]|nr:hypothetical protein [Frankiaceae bacterium]MDX6275665.1 hypothetical protein [Frankiales bacterium]